MALVDLIPFLIGLIIGVPSAALYCLELWIIFTHFSEFSSSFFVLVIVRTVTNLVNFVFNFVTHRFGKIGLFLPLYLAFPQLILAFLFLICLYALHVDNLITVFLLLNRLTSLIRPMSYEKYWRLGIPVCLAITFVIPLPVTVPILWSDIFIHVQYDNETFTMDFHPSPNDLDLPMISTYSALAFMAICLALNLASFFAYKIRNKKNANVNKLIDTEMERKMTIYTVATFASHLIIAIFAILIHMTALNLVDDQGVRYSLFQKWFSATLDQNEFLFLAVFSQIPWVNDLCTVAIPAWLLLWASTRMRAIVKKKIVQMTSTSVVNQGNSTCEQNVHENAFLTHLPPTQTPLTHYPGALWVLIHRNYLTS